METKAVPQTPQDPRGLTCVFYKRSTKYSSSAADTLKLYHHIPSSGCPFDIWQQTWVRHEHIQGRNATECNTLFTSYNNPIERKKERKPLFASFSSRGKAGTRSGCQNFRASFQGFSKTSKRRTRSISHARRYKFPQIATGNRTILVSLPMFYAGHRWYMWGG